MSETEAEMPENEQKFYTTLAQELIKSSITRIETNSAASLPIVSLLGTLYGAIVGFFVVTSQYIPTVIGGVLLATPEILLIVSAFFIARTIMPLELQQISISSPDSTYEAYSSIVTEKSNYMKWCFVFLILALVFILIVMLSLAGFRDILLQKIISSK